MQHLGILQIGSQPTTTNWQSQQLILPYCRLLINQIDSNHKERKPEGLACNVMLIRELNNNIQTVIKLYQDLSAAVESIGTPER